MSIYTYKFDKGEFNDFKDVHNMSQQNKGYSHLKVTRIYMIYVQSGFVIYLSKMYIYVLLFPNIYRN